MNEVIPDSATRTGSTAAAHKMTKGAVVALVLIACLLLFGIVICLRRLVSRRSLNRTADTNFTPSGVSLQTVLPYTMGRRESETTVQGQYQPFDHNDVPQPHLTISAAQAQGRRNQQGRRSLISVASSISMSIRFAVAGSFNSSADSYPSRATVSVIAVDGSHTPDSDPYREPVSPRHHCFDVDQSLDHSATWRGANLSNIINAARGVKN